MNRTHLSLYYLAGYLLPAGILLLLVPDFATKLLLSNRTYDDAPSINSVTIMEFRGDKVFRETVYICDPWEPPEWRAQWVEPMTEF